MNNIFKSKSEDEINVILSKLSKSSKNDMLLNSACYGHLDLIKILIESNANINTKDEDDWTPLMIASAKGYNDIVRYLLNCGANINAEDDDLYTALDLARKYKHKITIGILYEHSNEIKNKKK